MHNLKSVGVAMPVFNESDGIADTLLTLDKALFQNKLKVELFIQDDCSTDNTRMIILSLASKLAMNVNLEMNEINLGHGPTTLSAYRRAVESNNSTIMQLDSDGQFDPNELVNLIGSVNERVPIVIGVRTARVEPWFRKLITLILKQLIGLIFGCERSDPNSPIRVYERTILQELLNSVPSHSLIPNIHLTLLANSKEIKVSEIAVTHKARRGSSTRGTMWQSGRSINFFIPKRLIMFSVQAFIELWRSRKVIKGISRV